MKAIIRVGDMDRDEAIELLKSGLDGVTKWNQWRKRSEDSRPEPCHPR